MARYTMELRRICENLGQETVESWFADYQLEDYLTADEIEVINTRGTWSKKKLAHKIVEHYYMREIGLETVGLFKQRAKVIMQEIMEEKLPLIYSAAIKYDPLVNVDYKESFTGKNTGKTTSASNGLSVGSDTPMGQVKKSDILAGKYATSTNANEVADNSDSEGTQEYVKHIKGNSGVSATAQKMVELYRDNIMTIDRDIINELANIFMNIY